MKTRRSLLQRGVICIFSIGLSVSALAETAVRRAQLNSQIDINDDGLLDRTEVLLGLKNLRTDGGLDLPTIKAEKKLPKGLTDDQKLLDRYEIFLFTQKSPPPYKLSAVDPAEFGILSMRRAGPAPVEVAQRRYNPKFDINLRRETKQLFKALEDPYAQGALFSYGRNYHDDTEQLTAKGVLGLSYTFLKNEAYDPYFADREAGKPDLPQATNYQFLRNFESLLTFEFDRLHTDKADEEGTDRLAFGLHAVSDLFFGYKAAEFNQRSADADRAAGGEVDISKFQNPFLRSVLLDISATWTTDSSFDRNIQSVAVDATPFVRINGSGRFGHLGSDKPWLSYRWNVTAHFEAGTVKEPGSTDERFKTDEFWRAGGSGTIELLILPIALHRRLSAETSYLYYQALNEDASSVKQFKASLQWIIGIGTGIYGVDDSGARSERQALTALRLEFVNGTTPVTLEREKSLLLGLGVAF